LRRLVGAQFLSESGDGVITVALPLYVLSKTDSAIAMSLRFTAQMLGGALLGVVGGVLADRFDRQMVLKASFLIRALLLVVAWLVSPVAAVVALTVWVIGEQPTLAVAAALFVAAICIHLTLPSLDHGVDSRRQEHHESSWLELASGMAVVTTTPFVRRLVLYWFLSMATVSMAMASAAVWFEETLAADGYWYGLSVSAYGIGTAAATLVFGRRHFTMSLPAVLLMAAPAYAATCAVCVIADVPWLFPIGWLLWGLAFGPEIVRGEPEFLQRIDASSLGRAYAGLGVAITLGMAVGYAVAGPLLDQYGARTTTYVTAVAILAIGTMWIGPARRHQGLRADHAADETIDTHIAEVRSHIG